MKNMIVYAMSHPITGEVRYIGKSERGLRRPKEHGQKYHYKRLAHTPLYRWINKLRKQGLDYTIEIVEEFSSRELLMEGERFYISYFRSLGFRLLNICDGGEGFTGKHTKEAKEKIRLAGVGREFSEETKIKISEGNKGIKKRLGQKNTPEHRKNISNGRKGIKFSDSHKENIRKSKLAYCSLKENREKMSRANGGKPFVDNYGNIYQTQSEAAQKLGVDQGSIRQVLVGKSIQVKAHVFAYLDSLGPEELPRLRNKAKKSPMSVETKLKLSKINMNRIVSHETRQKMSKSASGRVCSIEARINGLKTKGKYRPFKDQFGNVYQTNMEAQRKTGISNVSIRNVLVGKYKNTKGYVFTYLKGNLLIKCPY